MLTGLGMKFLGVITFFREEVISLVADIVCAYKMNKYCKDCHKNSVSSTSKSLYASIL